MKILICGAPIFQIPIIEKSKQMGLKVGIIDIDPNAPGIQYADEYFAGSLRDPEQIYKIAQKYKPDGIIIGACDTSVYSASYVAQKLGLPGHSVQTAINSTDKLQMLKAFENNNVAHPQYQFVKKDEIESFNMAISYPAISKPIDSSGSRGIFYIENERNLKDALYYSSKASRSGNILVEEYMNGPEVSVEMLVINSVPHVLQITDKITSGSPYFFEIGHSQPSCLSDEIKKEIIILAKKAVVAVGLVNSPAHVEIKITDKGPKMVELGARMGGDCISTYLLDTSINGVCLTEVMIRMALGEIPQQISYNNSGLAVAVRFIPLKNGIIKSITGIEQAYKHKDLIKLNIYGKIGECYTQKNDNSSRIGFVVSKGKTTKDALNNCNEIINSINIEYI